MVVNLTEWDVSAGTLLALRQVGDHGRDAPSDCDGQAVTYRSRVATAAKRHIGRRKPSRWKWQTYLGKQLSRVRLG
jgi:hypothetical protein